VQNVFAGLAKLGLSGNLVQSGDETLITVQEDTRALASHLFNQIPGVAKVIRLAPQYAISSFNQDKSGTTCGATANNRTTIKFANGTEISNTASGSLPIIIAGPCSVEGKEQVVDLAYKVKAAGAKLLRGGAFKPRTSPYDFRGLGKAALEYLAEAKRVTGLPVVSEVMSCEQIADAEPHVDMYQIGARNMYNYELLKEVGKTRKPILLKRAMSATIDEFLQAAEYILLEGNLQVVLCERGIRSFDTQTRNTLDLSAVALLKTLTHLPVLVDPSHATGRRDLIRPMSRAAIACGADGLIIEVHDNPQMAMSDHQQAITPNALAQIAADVQAIHQALTGDRESTTTSANHEPCLVV
jgi:3-deoxy-7-phosphoheptulonate synthase